MQITLDRMPVLYDTHPELAFRFDFSVAATPTRGEVTILKSRRRPGTSGLSLNRFTDLAENPMTDSSQPFLSHQTRSFCALNLGHTPEVVK